MQTVSLSSVTQQQIPADIVQTMQPQPTQNMYIPPNGNNQNGNMRTTQQTTTGLFRGPPTNATSSRSSGNGTGAAAARPIPMQTIYQQATMHQGVVVPAYTQFAPRQPYQTQQFSFTQPIQTNYYTYPYQYLQHPQAPPPPHQRNAVAVTANVNVGTNLQPGPNGTQLAGPPGTAQPPQIQMPPAGSVLASQVTAGGGAVLSVQAPTPGHQVAVPSMVGVVPTSTLQQPPTLPPVPQQQVQQKRRRHALEIIDPHTNKNILEDFDIKKSNSNSDQIDYVDHISNIPSSISAATSIQSEIHCGVLQKDHLNLSNGESAPVDMRNVVQQHSDSTLVPQPQQREVPGQTPIVSAMSDGPSVEILSIPQKLKNKKIPIIAPKDESNLLENETAKVTNLKQQAQSITQQSNDITTTTTIIQNKISPATSISSSMNVVNNDQQIKVDVEEVERQEKEESHQTHEPQMPQISEKLNKVDHNLNKIIQTINNNNNYNNNNDKSGEINETISQPYEKEFNKNEAKATAATTTTFANNNDAIENQISNQHQKEVNTNDDNDEKKTANSKKKGIQRSEINKTSSHEVQQTADNIPYGTILTENEKDENDITITNNQKSIATEDILETDRVTASSGPSQTNNEIDKTDDGKTEEIEINKVPKKIAINDDTQQTSDSSSMEQLQKDIVVSSLINYNDDQWSPHNPNGKKQYNREQLLQLRDAKASRIQPDVNNISILPQPNLMPSFVRIHTQNNQNNHKRVQSMIGSIGGNNNRNNGTNDSANSNNSGNFINKQASLSGVHGRGSTKGLIHINLSLNQDVKLNETDNAWRPRVLVKGEIDKDPQLKAKCEKDELIRRVRGILNKLTPEKFDTLVEEIIKLKIDTPDKVEEVMVLVFEKAIDEPNFSVSYARLCHRLINEVKARDERMETGTKSNLAHFRNALLDKTEREFTQNVTQTSAKEKKLQPIIERIKTCTDLTEKAELEALLEEEERKIRRRSGGTVRFIGELFKISMLTGKIIHSCIDALLNPNSEDMLECLCKLLTTVGAKFELTPINSKEPTRCYSLEKIIAKMQAISSKTDKDGAKVSSRVRFMLQDVIDLRKNKWQSTRNEAPKTMEQIEKEAKTELYSSQYLNNYGSGGAISSGVSGSGSNNNQVSNIGSSGSSSMIKRNDERNHHHRFNNSETRSSSGSNYGSGGSHGSQRGERRQQQQQQGGSNIGSGNNIIGGSINNNNDDNTWHIQTGKGNRSLAVDTNKLEGLLNQSLDMGTKKMGGVSQFIWNNDTNRQTSTTATSIPSNSFAALSALVDNNKGGMESDHDRSHSSHRNKGSYNKNSIERDRYSGGIHSRNASAQGSRENSSPRNSHGGPRGMMNVTSSSSLLPKSASQSKYVQNMSSSTRATGKQTIETSSYNNNNNNNNQSRANDFTAQYSTKPNAVKATTPPAAVFEESNDNDLKIIKSIVVEIIEIATNTKTINSSIIPCINRIKESQRCGFIYYILTDYLHLGKVGYLQRRYLANAVAYLINENYLSTEHFKLSYEQFCDLVEELIVDIPELWLYVCEFAGPLIKKKILRVNDLWCNKLKVNSKRDISSKFLKTYLQYCTREIGPAFTRQMWRDFNMNWTDYMPSNDVEKFIQIYNFNYIEDDTIKPVIEIKESKEKHLNKVMENVDNLLREGSDSAEIIDYINGNFVNVDKHFVRSLTTTLCNFFITFSDESYKLNVGGFQKIAVPILQGFINSQGDQELECLYSMQLLVHSLEHPRNLLSELFAELYDADIIPQDTFIKWRDSKDQSAGKGVAVKGLNQFFTLILSGETSDE